MARYMSADVKIVILLPILPRFNFKDKKSDGQEKTKIN